MQTLTKEIANDLKFPQHQEVMAKWNNIAIIHGCKKKRANAWPNTHFETIHWEDWPSLTECEDLKDFQVQEQLCLAGCTVINVCIDAQLTPFEPSNNIQQVCWNSKSQQFFSEIWDLQPSKFPKELDKEITTYTSVTWEILVVVFATHVMPVHAGGPHGSLPCQFDNFPCPETILFLKASRAAAATKKKDSVHSTISDLVANL